MICSYDVCRPTVSVCSGTEKAERRSRSVTNRPNTVSFLHVRPEEPTLDNGGVAADGTLSYNPPDAAMGTLAWPTVFDTNPRIHDAGALTQRRAREGCSEEQPPQDDCSCVEFHDRLLSR